MKPRHLLPLLSLACLALLASGCIAPGTFVVRLSQKQVQQKLEKRFPVEAQELVFQVRLEQPVVSFVHKGQLAVGVNVVGLVAGMPVGQAVAVIRGNVRYGKETHEFFLTEPVVDRIDTADMPPEYTEQLRQAVNEVARSSLADIPIYQLDPKKHKVERELLTRAWICGKMLCLQMSI